MVSPEGSGGYFVYPSGEGTTVATPNAYPWLSESVLVMEDPTAGRGARSLTALGAFVAPLGSNGRLTVFAKCTISATAFSSVKYLRFCVSKTWKGEDFPQYRSRQEIVSVTEPTPASETNYNFTSQSGGWHTFKNNESGSKSLGVQPRDGAVCEIARVEIRRDLPGGENHNLGWESVRQRHHGSDMSLYSMPGHGCHYIPESLGLPRMSCPTNTFVKKCLGPGLSGQ
jgi:hypothetical protein